METPTTTSSEETPSKIRLLPKSETKATKDDTSNQSAIDPSRKTAGAIYREAALNNSDLFVEAGDLTRELTTSLVDDLNEAIASDPYDGKPFYITVYEKKDLQMQRAILRRLYTSKYRPYPEDDTVVFHVEPKRNRVKFCWCLPHSSEMDNMLANHGLYSQDMIYDIKAWKAVDLKYFGFDTIYLPNGGEQLVPSLENRDKPMNFSEQSVSYA